MHGVRRDRRVMVPESAPLASTTGETAPSGDRRRTVVTLIGLALLGALVGVASKSADASASQWVRDRANGPAVFVFAVSLLAWRSPGPVGAALRSVVFFSAMCVAYYAWSSEA
ncbi:MAG TPA: hypothetical protein VGV93_09445, partial [Acidimicrobiales bacterium]|nr:hypothetical protein [Acidimicrobiales bacterium]